MDELEAIRLADHEGRYQEQAAKMMNISRQTFGRIIDSAHGKIAHALITASAIKIDGGNIQMIASYRRLSDVRDRRSGRGRKRCRRGGS
jgi:predicted DNA-binding protein (UPF0251 family)